MLRLLGRRPFRFRRQSRSGRWFAFALVAFLAGTSVIVFPQRPAAAAPPVVRAGLCTVKQWQADFASCVDRLSDVAAARAQCLKAPTPEAPDSGLGGWFATRPESSRHPGITGQYTRYGYAGYSYTTYDIGCAQTLMHPDYKFENTIANGEFMLATALVGASNAVRDRAWNPGTMWSWADPLVEKATRALYKKVFTIFGAITIAVVGLYLLWRSRQAQMSSAMTVAGWALLVMVLVTAVAKWPTFSAHLADRTLVSSLAVVHNAVGPPSKERTGDACRQANKAACKDNRPPALRASDTAVETMLYRNWLRGTLGSSDSATAQKYGRALLDAKALTWDEAEEFRSEPAARDAIIRHKATQWMKVAEQIRAEDPEAYEYLTGAKGMERIGAGLIALVGALFFGLFDLTASVLVLLGFLIFRWAVVAAPLLGTIGLLRPASAGIRRLFNAVVAAIFNIVIFGSGAAIYLFAVDLIMNTPTLPGWLQVVLVGLCGVVGWLLLRPYRRITQLGGGVSAVAALAATNGARRAADAIPAGNKAEASPSANVPPRVELRPEAPLEGTRVPNQPQHEQPSPSRPPAPRRIPAPAGTGWAEPEIAYEEPAYTIYRPTRARAVATQDRPAPAPKRAEARTEP